MIEAFRKIRELRDRMVRTRSTKVVAAIATALGCAYKGTVPHGEVCDVALQAVDAGCDELALADTTGLMHDYVGHDAITEPICSRTEALAFTSRCLISPFHRSRLTENEQCIHFSPSAWASVRMVAFSGCRSMAMLRRRVVPCMSRPRS